MTSNNPSFSPTSLESVDLLSFDQRGSNNELQSPSSNLEQINEQEVEQQKSVEESAADNNTSSSIIYQIDFDVEHVGKNKPQSKRVAIWRYQMNNGNDEHETKLTWSTHSGKYTISVDGIDVYNNIAKGSVLEYKFKWNFVSGCVSDDIDDKDTIPLRVM